MNNLVPGMECNYLDLLNASVSTQPQTANISNYYDLGTTSEYNPETILKSLLAPELVPGQILPSLGTVTTATFVPGTYYDTSAPSITIHHQPEQQEQIQNRNEAFILNNQFFKALTDAEIASRHLKTGIEFHLRNCTCFIHPEHVLYTCRNCNENFGTLYDLFKHVLHAHDSKPNEFIENRYEVISEQNRIEYVINHTLKDYKCFKCMKQCSDLVTLLRHLNTHLPVEKTHVCNECGRTFRFKRYLTMHKTVHDPEKRIHDCKMCSKRFKSKECLNIHELQHHQPGKPYACDTCGKQFAVQQYLRTHKRRHGNETGRVCHVCGKILKNEQLCAEHVKERHGNVNPNPIPAQTQCYECPECGKVFPAHRNLQTHMKLHGVKRFKCDVCGKEFHFRRVLEDHIRLHTGEKPHVCSYCGKRFRLMGALYKHVRIHTGERPFVCGECGRGFTQLTSLHVHRRTHTKEKPFKCDVCGKCYAQSYVLRQHVQKNHK